MSGTDDPLHHGVGPEGSYPPAVDPDSWPVSHSYGRSPAAPDGSDGLFADATSIAALVTLTLVAFLVDGYGPVAQAVIAATAVAGIAVVAARRSGGLRPFTALLALTGLFLVQIAAVLVTFY
jgi:hypothetical protein